jgi:exonuclease III
MAKTNIYLLILTLNVSSLNPPIKRHILATWIKEEDPIIRCLQETHITNVNRNSYSMKRLKKIVKNK